MKQHKRLRIIFFVAIYSLLKLAGVLCQAHEQNVHMRISEGAFLSSEGMNAFLKDSLGSGNAPFVISPKITVPPDPLVPSLTYSISPLEWIKVGSYWEDGVTAASLDFLNHFYTIRTLPTRFVTGLTDSSEFAYPGRQNIVDSFTWTSTLMGRNPVSRELNLFTWPDTRAYQFKSLTESSKSTRDKELGLMLKGVSPGHCRKSHEPHTPTIAPVLPMKFGRWNR